MTPERFILAFAGTMVLISVALTAFASAHFIWLTVFVGLNLILTAFTGFCPAIRALRALGVNL